MKFYKYEGTGNDFICIDNRENTIQVSSQQVKSMCDRKLGIGADGVIIMSPSRVEKGDIFMDYRNSDGSVAEMCGNGVRVTARFAQEQWNIQKKEIFIDTRDSIKPVLHTNDDLYCVNMGKPRFEHDDFPKSEQKLYGQKTYFVSMGNPHTVSIFESERELDDYFFQYASFLESNTALFPQKININGVWRKSETVFGQKTYERGVGLTLACGTGASACFAWIEKLFPDLVETKIEQHLPGGNLFFSYNPTGEILMEGPSRFVFSGEIYI